MSYSISYNFKFLINSENYRERILDFDIAFIKIAHRYGLMYLGDIDVDEFVMDYRSLREQEFFEEGYENYYLLDMGQLNILLSKKYNSFILFSSGYDYNTKIFYNEKCIGQFIHFLDIGNMSDFFARDLEGLVFWEQNASLGLFFDNEDLCNMPYDTKVAYIPKFNSFLRDISKVVKGLGGKIETDCMVEEFITPDGFLLNERIIYQDDIEDGKEPFPITPPPYIQYWLEPDTV